MTREKIRGLIAQMSLTEKIRFCSGTDNWHTMAIPRLDIPSLTFSDGPYGLRKEKAGGAEGEMEETVCYPTGCAAAASFDRELLYNIGGALGDDCRAYDVDVILGPAVNIKRSPLCGRNFEYFSEDALVASELAGAMIRGIQSRKTGACVKHFYANNQETRRVSGSSEVEERALREIYLAAFEGTVKEAKPYTMMCSYNKINGTYAAADKNALTDILRGEWQFDGFVMSDWGAVDDRVADIKAGLDLEMPYSGGIYEEEMLRAVETGELPEEVLDQSVERILDVVFRIKEQRKEAFSYDPEKNHRLAEQFAEETMVLLKNEGILPLDKKKKIAFIGEFAKYPRFQGGGSAHVNCVRAVSAREASSDWPDRIYERGYDRNGEEPETEIIQKAAAAAVEAEIAVIFAGLPDEMESEGYDRNHMKLPQCQNRLIEEVAKVQKNTVVVLHNGSPVEMPWINDVKAVLETYLSGEGSGRAVIRILSGEINPGGRLPETFPLRLEHNPSWLNFPGEGDITKYQEGIFVGYRYYETKKLPVLFPFGHGLSYTEFSYSDLRLDRTKLQEGEELTVRVDVTNTGKRKGKEVVQLYVEREKSLLRCPARELRAFTKIELEPGERTTVELKLGSRAFSCYHEKLGQWYMEPGKYYICVGKNARDMLMKAELYAESSQKIPLQVTRNTPLIDLLQRDETRDMTLQMFKEILPRPEENSSMKEWADMVAASWMQYMPLREMVSFFPEKMNFEKVDNFIVDAEAKLMQ